MELKGKKINFLGDSITEGAAASCKEKIYHQVMKEKYGLAEARNYGIGGTRIARQSKKSSEEKFDRDFCMRVDEMSPDADIVIVFGGTNDFGHGDAPIGSFDDRDVYTFYGACHVLMQMLIEKYIDSVIVIATPLHRVGDTNPKGENKETAIAPLKRYVEVIREVAEYYSLPVVDLYSISGLQPELPVIKEKYCNDGLHPNDAGHAIIAERIGNFLLSL